MNLAKSKTSGHVNFLTQQFDRQNSVEQCEIMSSSIKKSQSASCIIVNKRGFKPSDRHDPRKKEFLTSLSQKLWHVSLDENTSRENKPIDLEKLFTPASDSGEITPAKNRKMFSSSSFYSPIHPTMEDQVKLARRISSSLCDISNKQSKGQSMYVNRMKRSVKWVHGGGEDQNEADENLAFKIPNVGPKEIKLNSGQKDPLKLVMNPHGRIQDINSIQAQSPQGPLTPEKCFDLVRDLNNTKGKGAELFAKRRKRSEKWVVDETTVKQTTTTTVQKQESLLEKTYTQNNATRQEQVKKLNEIQERLSQPKLKLVKSPWEAALETGSVDAAFQEAPPVFPTSSTPLPMDRLPTPARATPINEGVQKSALLLPNIPRGWGSAQARQLTYGSVKLNPAEAPPTNEIRDPATNSQSATSSASGLGMIEPPSANQYCHQTLIPEPTLSPMPEYIQSAATPSRFLDYSTQNNYNTAPRGWKQNIDYYRPVTFTPSTRLPDDLHYTEF